MKKAIVFSMLTCFVSTVHVIAAQSEWSFLTYIQSDNDLDPYSTFNVMAMQVVGSPAPVPPAKTSATNILVQWDKRKDNKTYRYKLLQQNVVEKRTLDQEMGYSPAKEIVDSMKWVKQYYPAKRYALVLWDHGNGILDRSGGSRPLFSWLRAPGTANKALHTRGVLYDYSQGTFLDSAGLSQACSQVKAVIKQNIDILGMDACLMAMIEVAYQVRDSVNYLVGSQQTEPGTGWEYTESLRAFVGNPTIATSTLASALVTAYKNFYSSGQYADSSFTQSVINVTKIAAATTAFNNVLTKIIAAQAAGRSVTNTAIKTARNNTTAFYIDDYVDLINLYDNLSAEFTTLTTSRRRKSRLPRDVKIGQAATNVVNAIAAAKTAAQAVIVSAQSGDDYAGTANGISIYFPANGRVNKAYAKTAFALATQWPAVLTSLQD